MMLLYNLMFYSKVLAFYQSSAYEVYNKNKIVASTATDSHLCVFSKEPVPVATLNSQQGILMLLFQLDDLLFQRSVSAFGASGGAARI